jgi:hypothetical protein
MTFADAEEECRYRTQHTTDTVRLTPTRAGKLINRMYRHTRTRLIGEAPRWDLQKTATLTVALGASVDLAVSATSFASIWRVETKGFTVDGESRSLERWAPVHRASDVEAEWSEKFAITFEERGLLLDFKPEALVSGTFRVLYHRTPADVSGSNPFVLPGAILDEYLLYKISEEICKGDRDWTEARRHEEAAEKEWRAISQESRLKRYGVHGDYNGLLITQNH